ncbi:tRNA uridine-5-carboxymethylaminomethyl(34) synthesis GTPase MnmE [Sphingomonas montana]|uniref:tRNA uridine-5-carboxymethylaminomethyl(34) synthesis GTPase MnmE n=1 Tax=Sphingomonas montana TaxID=1843236 RepID=UPI00096E390F|nr:tRNA uridine-5-carboxymethylaminomethyl(34) synthesis GTPase MnmE [Sphingomonas montana]
MPDTIFALSSGAPPAGIAVVRISGPSAATVVRAVAGGPAVPRRATLRTFRDAQGATIDRGLLLWFPGPSTATGEDLAELHLHGGRAVVARMLVVLSGFPDCRIAAPGEFTRRAFANGRLDLLEAEALGDLLSAETEQQRRTALAMADGTLGRQVDDWRRAILRLAAQVEASLDFGDEDDVASDTATIAQQAAALADAIATALAAPAVERVRDGIAVVLAGPPNAGKSSLLNRITGRDAAIVSPAAGTTRDVVEVPVAIDGTAFLFSDTAGLRDGGDMVERIGIDRARGRIADADLLLWLGDDPPPPHPRTLWLFPRADIRTDPVPDGRLAVSSATGRGLPALIAWLHEEAAGLLPAPAGHAISRRQRAELTEAQGAMRDAANLHDAVLQAEALRRARLALDRLTGRSGFEELLDSLFGQFCLGK